MVGKWQAMKTMNVTIERFNHLQQRHSFGPLAIFILLSALTLTFGCNTESHGFVLPEGEALLGEMVFIKMHCNQCHSVADIEWVGNKEQGDVHVELGGEVSTIKTYGELVTSVMNPSHKIARGYKEEGVNQFGRSKMKLYNEIMTVQELIDLVTYLQDQYELKTSSHEYYPAW